tara:strand:- start:378 stop:1253 length:876 start_codon:yes stop_codon:yes gene_type:complete
MAKKQKLSPLQVQDILFDFENSIDGEGQLKTKLNAKNRKNKKLALSCTEIHGQYIRYFDSSFLKDPKIMFIALKNWDNEIGFYEYPPHPLKIASKEIKNNKKLVLEAVKNFRGGFSLQYASASLKKDKDVVLAAVKSNMFALDFANKKFLKDPKIIYEAMLENWEYDAHDSLLYLEEILRKNFNIPIKINSQMINSSSYKKKIVKANEFIIYNKKIHEMIRIINDPSTGSTYEDITIQEAASIDNVDYNPYEFIVKLRLIYFNKTKLMKLIPAVASLWLRSNNGVNVKRYL